jgi:hypothetical protein
MDGTLRGMLRRGARNGLGMSRDRREKSADEQRGYDRQARHCDILPREYAADMDRNRLVR